MLPKRTLFRLPSRSRARIREDVDDELAFYLDERSRELERQGLSAAEARAQAAREFGDMDYTRRYCVDQDVGAARDEARTRAVDELWQDLAFATRTLGRTPLVSALAIATLALGIAATTSMFTVVRAVLLESLPYESPESLVRVSTRFADGRESAGQIAAADLVDFQTRQRTLAGLAGFASRRYVYEGPENAAALAGSRVSSDFFELLGARPALGRTILSSDSAGSHVVLLAYDAWRRAFGGDPAIVGRNVRLNGEAYTVVGVMPEGFVAPMGEVDIWTVLDLRTALADVNRARKFRFLGAVGRLGAGQTVERAAADLDRIAEAMAVEHPETNAQFRAKVVSLRDAMVGSARQALLALMGASALLLLIACANVAGLALARSVSRSRELAIRNALGAGRARLVRQMLVESVTLSLLGGAAGVALAWWGTRALGAAAARVLPPLGTVDLDLSVLLFAVGASVASGVLFGTAPSLAATRLDVARTLRSAGRTSTGGRDVLAPRSVLASAQIALAVMLLIGAGLFARSLVALQRVERGYDPTQLLTFGVPLMGDRFDSRAAEADFYDQLFARLSALPGVVAVGASGNLPLGGGASASLAIRGRLEAEGSLPEVGYVTASDDYFRAMRIPLRAGRFFQPSDRSDAPPVVIVSEGVAQRYFPDGDAVGARVRLGPDPSEPWSEVVGVVADVRLGLSSEARPTVYANIRQDAWGGAQIVMRSTGDPLSLANAVQREVRAVDPGVPTVSIRLVTEAIEERLSSHRLSMQLMILFAAVALVLAAIGVYGVIAYGVTARARELGVRAALGATPRDVLTLVLGRGVRLAAIGVVAGLVVAAFGVRLIRTLLYGVSPMDGWTFAGASVVIAAIALVASYLPARRATRVDPVTVLRAE
ncbi:MAG TPA: ABC transporter permease [Gemmatimonadaceae bacterium]|nr:ABC transporter permease [Gemmatimonadaceae bacterium]